MFKREVTTVCFLKTFFQRIEKDGTLYNLYCEASISLIIKPEKDIARRKNCKPMSLMNITTKAISKSNTVIHNKKIHDDQVGFTQEIQ